MPRLLLVDDNPSIHKIAETLLAPTDIELRCVESAKEALNLIAQGERFDVALIDTAMADTDGWALLQQFRMHPATATIPIAMMAGVLDTVDPERLEKAPIQGFLKKPVELRDLGDRVRKLLETRVEPVSVPPPPSPIQDASPFSTLPAVKLTDLPELRKPAVPEPPPEPETAPGLEPMAAEDDLLLLTEADLWPELPPPPGTVTEDLSPFAEIPPEESLDLEELDLESLRGLTVETGGAPAPAIPAFEPAPAPEPVQDETPEAAPEWAPEPVAAVLEPELESELELGPEPEPELEPVPAPSGFPEADLTQELPDLGPEAEPTFDPEALAALESLEEPFPAPAESPVPASGVPDPDFLSGLGEASITPDVAVVDWMSSRETAPASPSTAPLPEPVMDEDELDLGELAPIPMPESVKGFHLAEPESESWIAGEMPVLAAAPAPTPLPAPMPAEQATPAPAPTMGDAAANPAADAILRAITADPALMDQLAKALVAKLSDQVLREIAWEVMPEVAERLNRH